MFEGVLIDFSLTVKVATLIFISGRGSAISSAKQGKSGFIYNLAFFNNFFGPRKILTVYSVNSQYDEMDIINHVWHQNCRVLNMFVKLMILFIKFGKDFPAPRA